MSNPKAIAALVVTLALIGAGWLWLGHRASPVVPPIVPLAQTSWDAERAEAFKLQANKDWCNACEAWKCLKDKLVGDNPDVTSVKQEAERNIASLEVLCAGKEVSELKLPGLHPELRPQELVPEDLIKIYPVGRRVQSIAFLDVTGVGDNADWIYKVTSHFVYRYRVAAETTVKVNTGSRVVFEQHFKDVTHFRAVSKETIEIKMPDDPILETVWKQFEDIVLESLPAYKAVRKFAEIALLTDTRLKRSLTFFKDLLERNGAKLTEDKDLELVSRIDKLAGMKFELEYVSGLGVTQIKVLNCPPLRPDELDRLALNASLLMDYFVDRAASSKKVGDQVKLQVSDVAGLLSFGHDVELSGEMSFNRKENDKRFGGSQVLEVAGGEVAVQASGEGAERSGQLKPKSGVVYYSPDKHLVRNARMTWDANTNWFTKDHLLFGTTITSNLKIETYYEADDMTSQPQSPVKTP